MSLSIPVNQFQLEFSDRVGLLLQERGSKLRPYVTMGTHTGARAASPINQVGAITGSTPAARFAPLLRIDAQTQRRWVTPSDRELPQLLDRFDMLRYSQDFKGPFAENAVADIGRWFDDLIISAATGASAIGETGAGSEAFDTTNFRIPVDFGASGAVGLTVAKMIELRRRFASANVDLDNEPITLVITPAQEANLLNQIEVVSTDFNMRPVLVDGSVRSFLGMNIVVTNRTVGGPTGGTLDVVSTNQRRCFAFVKSGLYLGMWQDVTTEVTQRNDLSSLPWQIYTCATAGATRIEQGKVIEVLCSEA